MKTQVERHRNRDDLPVVSEQATNKLVKDDAILHKKAGEKVPNSESVRGPDKLAIWETPDGGIIYTLVDPYSGDVDGAVVADQLADWLEVDRPDADSITFRTSTFTLSGKGEVPIVFMDKNIAHDIADPTLLPLEMEDLKEGYFRNKAISVMMNEYHHWREPGTTVAHIVKDNLPEDEIVETSAQGVERVPAGPPSFAPSR